MTETPVQDCFFPMPHPRSRFQFRAGLLVSLAAGLLLPSWVPGMAQMSLSAEKQQAAPNKELADKKLNVRVNELLRQMTLEEKIGQLAQYTAGAPTGPGTGRDDYPAMIAKGQVGSLFNVSGAAKTNEYQRIAMEKSRLHIPLIYGLDVIHGQHTTFPIPLGLAAAFDPELVKETARVAGSEAAADGVRWVFSPMVDIARDARWGRIAEGAGEDVFLGSAYAKAYVQGYQGSTLSDPKSVAVSVKHFAAYGAPVAGRDYNTVDMSELALRQDYLPPYKAAVDAGAATLMSSFNTINGVPASANPLTLTQILRKEWGFDGFVVSDYGAVSELLNHGIALDGAAAAKKSLLAGLDMDMEGDEFRTRLATLVRSGEVPEAQIDESVRRILRVKYALGLFDHPYVDEKAPAYYATDEKRALARRAAEESLVLLKNDAAEGQKRLLPLTQAAKKVALIGPLADSRADMLGSWPGAAIADNVITLKSALDTVGCSTGWKMSYTKGTEILTDSEAGFAEALSAAQKADLVILALGENADTMTGEAGSRSKIDLPGNQEKLLEQVVATGKPVVLVVFSGRPLVLEWAAKHVPAIVEAWFPGIEAGPALVRTLCGAANPSGRLPVSFPHTVGQEPLYYNALPTGRPVPASMDLSHPPVGQEKYFSRYIDVENAALFPFGHGLSYTSFSYGAVKLSTPQIPLSGLMAVPAPESKKSKNKGVETASSAGTGTIHATAEVKNTGALEGTEVVQLYVRVLGASVERPVRELKGFERVTLKPGESKQVDFTLGFDELSFLNVGLQRVVEAGTKYTVFVGGSSTAENQADFTITQ